MDASFDCPHCRVMVFPDELQCPACRGRLRYKTFKEAYTMWSGLGIFDLIPGIRDLPYPIRFLLMAIVITLVLLVILPLIVLVLRHVVR